MYTYGFEKLDIWQLSRQLVKNIYQLTKTFPNEEKFGLTSQLRRAAISISSNIAEGNTRSSKKDKAHFLEIAYSSLMEVLNQLILAVDLEFIKKEDLLPLRELINEISNKTNSLRKNLRN
jgi:four helix bundle protein